MRQRPKSFDDAIDQLEDLAPGTRDRFAEEIDRLGRLWAEFEPTKERAGRAAAQARREMRRRPWLALGVVGLIGVVIGLFLARRNRRG